MRMSIMVLVFVLVGALVPWPVLAESCDYINIKVDFRHFGPIDPIPPYDWCVEVTKITGNLNGSYGWCIYFSDLEFTSDSIYGDGWDQIAPGRYYSWIKTPKGDIQFVEWSWWDGDFGIEVGFSKVVDGTEAYEGAFGSLFWKFPRTPIPGEAFFFPLEGYICTP